MPNLLKSKLAWAAAVVAALVGVYALVGYKVAPRIVSDQAVKFVRETYGRELRIGSVRIDPFKLQAEIRDLALPDADGTRMLAFERLFVDFELASLWKRMFIFKDVILEAPFVRAVIRPDGVINLLDLVPPEDPAEPPSPPPSLWLKSFDLRNGRIEAADLARRRPFDRDFEPVTFNLKDFRTTPEGGGFKLSAVGEAGESFDWSGRFSIAPALASQGEFSLGKIPATLVAEYLGDALPFDLTAGLIGLGGRYRFAYDEALELDLELPKIDLAGLSLRARGTDTDWVKVPGVTIEGTRVALPAQTVDIASIKVSGLEAQAWVDADGAINLVSMVAPGEPSAPAPAAAPAAGAAAPAANVPAVARNTELPSPWQVRISSLDVAAASIDFEDRMIAPVTKFRFAPVNLQVKDASLDLAKPLPVTLDAVINDHAAFKAEGTVTPDPLAADLAIALTRARMTILQPYVLPLADLTIKGGELDVRGRAKLDPPDAPGPEMGFEGDVTVSRFASVDNARNRDLVNFREVKVEKLRYAMAPDSVAIERIGIEEPYARVIVTEDRLLNIAMVLDPQGTAAELEARRAAAAAEAQLTAAEKRKREREQKAAEKAAAKARKAGKSPPSAELAPLPEEGLPIRIGEVRVADGTMDFTDLWVQPNFSAKIQKLGGTITGLSSDPRAHATIDLKGQVDTYSPVTIAGTIQPFAFERYTDVDLKFENISLPIFNPYSGQFAGYSIAKGKLTTDLQYLIQDRKLDAQHKIRIDQLEWGEPTAAKGEATLPVKFATSLLKDADGVINLDVPVSGTIDDPTFRIGPIVWQVIKNLITKAVTAPFKLLGALFAGAEEAQFVDFAAGSADLDPAAAERLGALAKSLVQRPEIKLDVPIASLTEVDGPALAERAYAAERNAALAVTKLEGSYEATPPAFESLGPKDRIAVLTNLLRKQSGAEPQVPEPPPPPEGTSKEDAKSLRQAARLDYLDKETRARATASPQDLGKLGEERARAVQQALLEGTSLEPARVFLTKDGKVSSQDGKVRLELGLQ
jgi:uncharacterized protein involved in outer membrane biogenesis